MYMSIKLTDDISRFPTAGHSGEITFKSSVVNNISCMKCCNRDIVRCVYTYWTCFRDSIGGEQDGYG